MLSALPRILPTVAIILIATLTLSGSFSILMIALFALAEGIPSGLLLAGSHFTPLVLGAIFYLQRMHRYLYLATFVIAVATIAPILVSLITYSGALPLYLEQGWLWQYFGI